jgi:hypothetical protein
MCTYLCPGACAPGYAVDPSGYHNPRLLLAPLPEHCMVTPLPYPRAALMHVTRRCGAQGAHSVHTTEACQGEVVVLKGEECIRLRTPALLALNLVFVSH